ncbi:hypothetical protein V7S43_007227 [Phytophthora oleae]|uniref:Myb-like DNA-binding protein n=1 Tax=Phytophthora oleae TaxID=2107226 RepID=A0ABD3FPX6_9STRA
MAITARVKRQYFQQDQGLIRLAPDQDHTLPTKRAGSPWIPQEHDLFLEALERYPSGPWKAIAAHIGTRTTRQTMTHAQKYREKISRWRKANTVSSSKTGLNSAQPTGKPRESAATVSTVKQEQSNEQEGMNAHCHLVEINLDDSIIAPLETLEPTVFGLDCPKSTESDAGWQVDCPFQQWIV